MIDAEFIEKTNTKKQYVSLLVVILPVGGLLFFCYDKMNKDTGALQLDNIQVNETTHLFNNTIKPACNVTTNFAYPVESSGDMLKDSPNTYFISTCFGDRHIGEEPEAVVKQHAKNYVDEYRHDQEPMYTKDRKNKENDAVVSAWYSYYESIESHVQLYEKDLLVYRVDYNEYTGGAHGTYMPTFLNMDLTLMHSLRLDGAFVGNLQEALTDLIRNQLVADNKVTVHEALEDMRYVSTGDIAPTENFYLGKEGITFYYNIYDITPYSTGPIRVTTPYSTMEHLLSSNSVLGDLRD